MEKIVQQALLYDFYGELLNEHQKSVYEEYVLDNLSLGEIAEELGISRQAVFDLIKRIDKTLNGYEDKLHLVSRFLSIKGKVNEIDEVARSIENDAGRRIISITEEILDEL